MGSRPILAGSPTVEINLKRYDELLHAEVKCEQYKEAFKKIAPSIVSIIEASDISAIVSIIEASDISAEYVAKD